jgi:uncharacterized protein (DUF1800 family)
VLRVLIAGLAWLGLMQGGHAQTGQALSRYEAARFLTQATFGPNENDIRHLQSVGLQAWLDEQFAMPASVNHLAALTQTPDGKAQLHHSFWRHVLSGPDQLRQRVALALSEIFVISAQDSCGSNHGQGVASYHDMLLSHAFGPYRTLLESVTLHPVMGC